MIIFALVKYFKKLPDKWIFCLTLLLLPISIGAGKKLEETGNLSFQHGQTTVKLGQIKAIADEGDRQIDDLLEENQNLTASYQKLKSSLDRKKVNVPELEEIEKAIGRSGEVADGVSKTQQELGRLTEEVVEVAEEER